MTIDDGPMRTQSMALLRYVGSTYSQTLYPTSKLLDIEEAIGIVEDFGWAWYPVMRPPTDLLPDGFLESEEGKEAHKKLREKFAAETIPKFMKYLTDLLERNDGNWLASSDEPTISDCLAVPFIRNFTRGHSDHIPTSCLDDYPKIVDYIKRFCALEQVKGRYNNGIF